MPVDHEHREDGRGARGSERLAWLTLARVALAARIGAWSLVFFGALFLFSGTSPDSGEYWDVRSQRDDLTLGGVLVGLGLVLGLVAAVLRRVGRR